MESAPLSYGLQRLDHAVGNVPNMQETLDYIVRATGFHYFAEFTAEVWCQGFALYCMHGQNGFKWESMGGDLSQPSHLQDVGTVDSGLNSKVLASNNEFVILPVNEPTFGTLRKSQIQTYLEQNEGPGLQHLALKSDDIFSTLRQMRQRSAQGGFDFMPRASNDYYRHDPATCHCAA